MMRERLKIQRNDRDQWDVWFELELLEGEWCVAYRLSAEDRQLRVMEIRLFPLSEDFDASSRRAGTWSGDPDTCPAGGITSTLVKDHVVPGEQLYGLLPELLREMHRTGGDNPLAQWGNAILKHLGFEPDVEFDGSRRGPKGRPTEYYAALARDYVALCEESRSPVVDLAEERGMTDSAVRAALHRARKRGLLTRHTQGRAGGELTDRAKELLGQQDGGNDG